LELPYVVLLCPACVAASAPDKVLDDAEFFRRLASTTPPAGVPRRFSLRKALLMTAVYAVVFTVMAVIGVKPVGFLIIGVFFTGVAASQALLFGGNNPRGASVLAGAIMVPAILIPWRLIMEWPALSGDYNGVISLVVADGFRGASIGVVLGYLAGALSAGVFLVHDRELEAKTDTSPNDGDPFAPAVVELVAEDPAAQEKDDDGE